MTPDEKLAAIQAAVQYDPVNRGLAHVPGRNLFTYCAEDFLTACQQLLKAPPTGVVVVTGFYIPTADPPAFETDGPLGALFLLRALEALGIPGMLLAEEPILRSVAAVYPQVQVLDPQAVPDPAPLVLTIERSGPAADGTCRTMRAADITEHVRAINQFFDRFPPVIGIGDGGNEVGMGKIPDDIIAANIPHGASVHCTIPVEHLVVAGVSNWGAYALAAGLFVLRGVTPPEDLFNTDRERDILEVMVQTGPLVDGVISTATVSVDGLPWEDYTRPLARLQEILAS